MKRWYLLLTTLLLTTTGRKSGNALLLPLIYRPSGGGGYCVIASKGGAPAHPAWFLNLQANPDVHVQVASEKFDAVARVAEGEEREKLWQLMVDYYGPYADYQAARLSIAAQVTIGVANGATRPCDLAATPPMAVVIIRRHSQPGAIRCDCVTDMVFLLHRRAVRQCLRPHTRGH